MRRRIGEFVRYSLLVVSISFVLLGLNRLYDDLVPDSLGEPSTSCDARGDLPSVPNGTGLVVTSHVTGCAIVLLATAYTQYVYVHRIGEADSARSLVFKYDLSGVESIDDPRIVWRDSSNLQISIPEVGAVFKQVNSIDGVRISYSIGKEDYARQELARDERLDEEITLAWMAFWAGVCALTVRSIRKHSPGRLKRHSYQAYQRGSGDRGPCS